jgi:hypothetical protein
MINRATVAEATIPGQPGIVPPMPAPPQPDVPDTTPIEEPDPTWPNPAQPDIKDPPLNPIDQPYQI